MAKVFLESQDTEYNVANKNVQVYGATGEQIITVAAGAEGLTLDQNVEGLVFAGPMSSYKFQSAGTTLKIYSADGTTLLATVSTQVDADGSQLTFSDVTTSAKLDAAVGGLAIDGVKVPTEAPGDLVKPLPAIEFTLKASLDSIQEGAANTFTVTASRPVEVDTEVTFALKPGTADTTDFTEGAFNPFKAIIKAGQTTVTTPYTVTARADDVTEVPEAYSVEAKIGDVVKTVEVTLLDGASAGDGSVAGKSFTLTKDVATTTGTSGNDTFIGILDGGTTTPDDGTYQIGDLIDGAAGTDTLNLTMIDGNPTAPVRADVKNVEIINIRNISGATAEFSATQISGATQIWSSESNQDLNVSNVANLVAVGLNKTEKNINVKFADTVVAGSADALTVALNEAGKKGAASTVTVSNQTGTGNVIEALTVSSTGSKTNYVDVSGVGNKVKTITATGSAALEVTVNPTAVVTVDTSAATGGVKMTGALVGTAADGLTVTGSATADQFTIDLTNKAVVNAGAGNDVVALTTVASLTTTDSINGGDGTDVLSLAVADAKTVAGNAARTVITGFETLRVTGNFADAGVDSFDISKFGINSLQVDGNSGDTANTVSNFTSGATVEFRLADDQAHELNINMKNATDAGTESDTLNIKLNANLVTQSTAADAFDVKVGVNGINILNVTTADADNTDAATKASDGYILTLSSAANVNVINVSGDRELSFASGIATNALKTLNATSLTGDLIVDLNGFAGTQGVEVKGGAGVNTVIGTGLSDIITGGAKDDILSGGAGNDTISGGDGKDTITGGAGADVLDGGAGVDTFIFAGGDAEVATFDTITNLVLGTGGDVLQLGGTTAATAANIKTLSAAAQSNVTAAATLAAAVTQVAVETSGAKIATTFTYGTDTYIFYNVADDDAFTVNTDMLIKITGASGALDASNITI